MKPSNCPSCGQSVLGITLESGRQAFVNREPHRDGNVWLGNPDGIARVVGPEPKEFAGQMVATDLFIGHGATCSASKRRR